MLKRFIPQRPPHILVALRLHTSLIFATRTDSRCFQRICSQIVSGARDSRSDLQTNATPSSLPAVDACGITTVIGQVMAAQANFVRVSIHAIEGENGTSIDSLPKRSLLCIVRGLLKKMQRRVLVGDFVRISSIDWADGRGAVEDILPRASALKEPPVANVTKVLLVFSIGMPPFQPSNATRFLVGAEAAGLPVLLVLNKADLASSEEELVAFIREIEDWGYRALPVSVADGRGLDDLASSLAHEVSVVAGPSGVGKSSIINALQLRSAGRDGSLIEMTATPSMYTHDVDDAPEQMRTSTATPPSVDIDLQVVGSVSQRMGRGKHTTRNVTLLELKSGGLLADTPGFNQPQLTGIRAEDLASLFPEVRRALQNASCSFKNCQHLQEPGCAVREGWKRHSLYSELHEELSQAADTDIARSTARKKREGTARVKSGAGGLERVEARLEAKSYRRESRRSVKQELSGLSNVTDIDDDID